MLAGILPVAAGDRAAGLKSGIDKTMSRPHQDLPALPDAWLKRMLQATREGQTMRHPDVFMAWLDTLSEPRYMTALGTVAMDANAVPPLRGQAMDPAAIHNWSEYADPALYLRWRAAQTNPGIFQAIYNRPSDQEAGRGAASARYLDTPPPLVLVHACLTMFTREGGAPGPARQGEWLKLPSQGKGPFGPANRTYRY